MSAVPVHGFSSITRGSQVSDVDPNLEVESERNSSSSAEMEALVNFDDLASRSSRQPRFAFSSFAPSSENDYPKRLKSDAAKDIPTQRKEIPEEDEVKKTWNLRPRKACGGFNKAFGGGASEVKNQESGLRSNRQRRNPAESFGSGGVEGTKENHRLWVSLSREEIEEDLFSISGNRPSRRPRKRSKALQKQIDFISPGSCLVGKNSDSFRVSNSPAKR